MVELHICADGKPVSIAAVVLDAYGTLLDVHSALARVWREGSYRPAVAGLTAERRQAFSLLWRDKQLAYTWLRNAMRCHADFEQVTADALDHAMAAFALAGETTLRQALLDAYSRLDAYAEVPEALERLAGLGLPLAILSNGTPKMLAEAVESAGIDRHLTTLISVETLGVFKPAPEVYALATRHFDCPASAILFLSSNGWDVHGAATFGCTVVHVDRQGAAPEWLPGKPAHRIEDLTALPGLFVAKSATKGQA